MVDPEDIHPMVQQAIVQAAVAWQDGRTDEVEFLATVRRLLSDLSIVVT
jgi:hypothetical protein